MLPLRVLQYGHCPISFSAAWFGLGFLGGEIPLAVPGVVGAVLVVVVAVAVGVAGGGVSLEAWEWVQEDYVAREDEGKGRNSGWAASRGPGL